MAGRFRSLAGAAAIATVLLVPVGPAFADDHLADASGSQGVDRRGFTNPVAGNPSATSGAAAQPGTVPGLGNPSSGEDRGTPAFDPDSLCERLEARSDGSGPGC